MTDQMEEAGEARSEKDESGLYVVFRDHPDEGNTVWRKKTSQNPGGYSEGVPPVPIPNTAVKPFSAENTWS